MTTHQGNGETSGKPALTHVSLNVSDLGRAVDFYRRFLGVEPARHHKDYAKFELLDPPLVLSLEPIFHRASDSFNHLGLRLSEAGAVSAMQARLGEAGLLAEREDDVECCYSRQTKFWLLDPDRNLWEVYALTGELEQRGSLTASDALAARDRSGGGARAVFEHRLGDALPLPLPQADASVDDVRLRGSFNTPRPPAERHQLLAEAHRILRPGGQLLIHGLVADRPLPGAFPRLPGPAALVRHVAALAEPLEELSAAGFVGTYLQKLGERANFAHDGVKMRELLLVAWKAGATAPGDADRTVVYRGPFLAVTDDGGRPYRRGERTLVDPATAARLERGPMADQFVFVRDAS